MSENFTRLLKRVIPPQISANLRHLQSTYRSKKDINRFSFRNNDLVFVSYPKSGSTWIRFIFSHLLNQKYELNKRVDFSSIPQFIPSFSRESLEQRLDFINAFSPRIFGTHNRYTPRFPKVVYLLRDGRDVMVSFYYFFVKRFGYEGSMEDFIQNKYLRKHWGEWEDHVNSWVYGRASKENNLIVVKYEELHEDPFQVVSKVLDFSGTQFSRETIEKAIDDSRFDKIQKIEKDDGLPVPDRKESKLLFMRSGKKKGWVNSLNSQQKKLLKGSIGDTLIRTGYEKDLDW